MEAVIRAENVSHVYLTRAGQEIPAIRDISLVVQPGEFVAIIGHNGSGKSTLARHFNALLVPTKGKMWVAGLDTSEPRHLWTIRQHVGMVFQNPDNQIVATTVEEDVAFGPENLGLPPAEIGERITAALRAVGMEAYRHHAPHRLSGGQKQRVAIAGVLAMRPACIVLDEPTAMLDPVGRREVLETVTRLNREEGITVLLITHFMEEAALAHRVLVMDEGRICLEGTPRQVFTQVAALRRLRLDVPPVVVLAQELRRLGLNLPPDLLTPEELAAALLTGKRRQQEGKGSGN